VTITGDCMQGACAVRCAEPHMRTGGYVNPIHGFVWSSPCEINPGGCSTTTMASCGVLHVK